MAVVNLLIYPRIIEVHRVRTNAGPADTTIGLAGYSGAEASIALADPQGEVVLQTGIKASIQASRTGLKKDSGLPQDVVFMPSWNIFTPKDAIAKGVVRDRDVIIDDEGYRYEVAQAYWNVLGLKLICIRVEA